MVGQKLPVKTSLFGGSGSISPIRNKNKKSDPKVVSGTSKSSYSQNGASKSSYSQDTGSKSAKSQEDEGSKSISSQPSSSKTAASQPRGSKDISYQAGGSLSVPTLIDRMGFNRLKCSLCSGHKAFRNETVFHAHMYNYHSTTE